MSVVLAVPAAVRLPRSAAAQRGLLTLLILGGFLVLAFLFGGSAQAASGPDHPGRGVSGASAGLLGPQGSSGSRPSGESCKEGKDAYEAGTAQHRREAELAAARTASQVIEVAESAGRTGGAVARPVGETADGVTEAAGLRGLSEQLGLRPGDGDEDAPGHGGGHTGPDPGKPDSPAAASAGAAYGPDGMSTYVGAGSAREFQPAGSASNSVADDGTSRGNDGVPHQLPFQQLPVPPASSTSQYAGDGSGPRGGAAHQLAGDVTGAEYFGLLQPGAVRAAVGTPARDRAAEILEFPG